MKGRSASAKQRKYWSLLCEVVGCIACKKDGGFNSYCLPHHIDGRTKKDAHWKVISLCAPHHQDHGVAGFIPVHPYKARFEAEYGSQMDLLRECIQTLIVGGFIVPDAVFEAAGIEKNGPVSVEADPSRITATT